MTAPLVVDPTSHPKHAAFMPWHLTLNNPSPDRMRAIAISGIYRTLTRREIAEIFQKMTCFSCHSVKLRNAPQKLKTLLTTSDAGQIICSDTMGPIDSLSNLGHKHVLTFIDQRSRYAISIPIKERKEVQPLVQSTPQYISTQQGRFPRLFHSDNTR